MSAVDPTRMAEAVPTPTPAPAPSGDIDTGLREWCQAHGVTPTVDLVRGWNAALQRVQRCAVHWRFFGPQFDLATRSIKESVKHTREGWRCREEGCTCHEEEAVDSDAGR